MLNRAARAIMPIFCLAAACLPTAAQQAEATKGFGLQGTVSVLSAASTEFTAAPRSGSLVDGGIRLMLYPTWRLSRHWTFYGAFQTVSRPYFALDSNTSGHGLRGSINQGYLNYSQVWSDASIQVRAGELTSAFGAFPLHYDDRDNPMVSTPLQYGYYGSAATLGALAGVEMDATWKRLDGRAQFTNSSPANPRSIFASAQYGSWAGGVGYTVIQGLRFGASAYYGPYLDQESQFYLPSEGAPRTIPATGVGVDAQWGRGHWNVRGEWQRFVMTYGPDPSFHERTGYAEAQRTLGPRWYAATRFGYLSADYIGRREEVETVGGYRPAVGQIIKLSYRTSFGDGAAPPDRTLAIQYVAAFHALTFTGH